MKVTSVKITPFASGKLKGFADVTFDEVLIVTGFKIFAGEKGLRVMMPSVPMNGKDGQPLKDEKGQQRYRNTISIEDKDMYVSVCRAVDNAYKEASKGGEPESKTSRSAGKSSKSNDEEFSF